MSSLNITTIWRARRDQTLTRNAEKTHWELRTETENWVRIKTTAGRRLYRNLDKGALTKCLFGLIQLTCFLLTDKAESVEGRGYLH